MILCMGWRRRLQRRSPRQKRPLHQKWRLRHLRRMLSVVYVAEATAQVAEASELAAPPMALYSSNEIDALRRIRNACANIILGLA